MFVVPKDLEQTLPKTACPGHAVVGKVFLVTSPKTGLFAFGCYWLYVRRSQGLWDDPAQDSMPRACRRELDALKYPILFVLRKGTDFLQTQRVMCMAHYGSSTDVEQEKGCPYPALATPQLKYRNIFIKTKYTVIVFFWISRTNLIHNLHVCRK